jgi:hypothetical protein
MTWDRGLSVQAHDLSTDYLPTPCANARNHLDPSTIKQDFYENTTPARTLHRPQKGNEGRVLAHPSPSQFSVNSPNHQLLEFADLKIDRPKLRVVQLDNDLAAILAVLL